MCTPTPPFWIQSNVIAVIWFGNLENKFLRIDLNEMAHILYLSPNHLIQVP